MKSKAIILQRTKQGAKFLIDIAPYLMLVAFLLFVMQESVHAAGTNYLSGLKDDVSATFGQESDVPKYLYLGEAILAAFAYMKTKNIMLLAGLPVLMIFTHFALKV